jgi:hypothetical protein
MRGFMLRTACLGVAFGCLAGGTTAFTQAHSTVGRPVATAFSEPSRIVRPGTSPHVYRTAPPPAPAPAKPRPSVGVLATAATTAPHAIYNWLRAEDGRISVAVGVYNDPTGQAVVPSGEAVLDLAMRMVPWYFDGHNPGVFTPLLDEGVGSYFDYWDSAGREHRFRIVAVRTWYRTSGEPPPVTPLVVAQFQTCKVADGSIDYIYDAVAA